MEVGRLCHPRSATSTAQRDAGYWIHWREFALDISVSTDEPDLWYQMGTGKQMPFCVQIRHIRMFLYSSHTGWLLFQIAQF